MMYPVLTNFAELKSLSCGVSFGIFFTKGTGLLGSLYLLRT